MYNSILKILRCPKCGETLVLKSSREAGEEVLEGSLSCCNNHMWSIKEGVIDFESLEQTSSNTWSEDYKVMNYEELDRVILERTPKEQVEAGKKTQEEIFKVIDSLGAKRILDIATGRGMLLTSLASHYTDEVELVCVDLSYEVLKFDRIKTMKLNPKLKVNYITCDATKLPFIDNAFDLSLSFFGIQNMGEFVPQGIKEGVRVGKNGLLNACIIIKDDNPKIEELNKLLKENNFDFDLGTTTQTGIIKLHEMDGIHRVSAFNAFEGTAGKNDNDLLPIEGEWFANTLVSVKETWK